VRLFDGAAIPLPPTRLETAVNHMNHAFGILNVITSPLEGRPGYFITCVMRNSLPFDAEISDSLEAAERTHRKFCIASALFEPMAAGLGEQTITVNVPNPGTLN
jgi:hypothetical protein